MAQMPAAPDLATSEMRSSVMPPMASIGSGTAEAAASNAVVPAAARPGFELVENVVPKTR
jgi:hypothetical protein